MGCQVALIYLATGLAIAILAGWVIGRLHLEKSVEEWVHELRVSGNGADERLTWSGRVEHGLTSVRDIVGKVWPYILIGVGVGAGIHGYVPEGALAAIMGRGAWWSVPLAVLLGIPMYSNAAGIIPVVETLLAKGAALGTVLAFMMAVIGLSLPEGIILRKVLKPQLIAVFFGVVGGGIQLVGYGNVEFRLGDIETLPVHDAEVDLIISNCVINLVPDKQKAFAEAFRVLKPGGRLHVSDIVLTCEQLPDVLLDLQAYINCIAGAVTRADYLQAMQEAGFVDVMVHSETDAAQLLGSGCCTPPAEEVDETCCGGEEEAEKGCRCGEPEEASCGCDGSLADLPGGLVVSMTVSAKKPL